MRAPIVGVRLDDVVLALGQLAQLEQDVVGHADLADVVQRRGEADRVHQVVGQAHRRGNPRRDRADALRVLHRVVVAELGGAAEPLENLELRVLELGAAQRDLLFEHVVLARERRGRGSAPRAGS